MPLLSQEELERIPPLYRLLVKALLKLPNPSMSFFVLKHFPELEGILWALVTPILIVLYFFFNMWLFSFVTLYFGFPLNYIISAITPVVIFVFFLRIQLERTILWWRNVYGKPKKWQISKTVEEFVKVLEKQQKKRKS
jgi:cellulose synthase/poly-beta-1,6-N-acetylglucosamine synthase-like glycosyltransferase